MQIPINVYRDLMAISRNPGIAGGDIGDNRDQREEIPPVHL